MKIVSEIWNSIKGNTITRARDPILGTLTISWILCNWEKLALLFYGSDKIEARVRLMIESTAVINNPELIVNDLDLVALPLLLTVCYLFAIPWISYWTKKRLNIAHIAQHGQAVDLDLSCSLKQKELNKSQLRANPEKSFLAVEVEMDLQREKDKIVRRNMVKEYIDKKASAAKADAEIKKSTANITRIDLEKKTRLDEIEKQKHIESTAIHRSTLASNRFPTVYFLLDLLAKSLEEDNVVLSIEALSDSVAATFGYDSFAELLDDDTFNNENISKLKYIYNDSDFLSTRLEEIMRRESPSNEDATSDLLFDHIYSVFDTLPYKLLSDESLAEIIYERVSENSYEILMNSDELSGPIAESNTCYEEVYLELEGYNLDTDFTVNLTGTASGSHYKESDVGGRDLSVNVTAICTPTVGRFGFQDYNLEISGGLEDYGDTWEMETEEKKVFNKKL